MILNVIFLAGGIGIGYLIRGELDRRKSKKAWSAAIDEGLNIAKTLMDSIEKKENDEIEEVSPDEISFDTIADMFKDATSESNSTDETIKL
jgi:hypothetical protein